MLTKTLRMTALLTLASVIVTAAGDAHAVRTTRTNIDTTPTGAEVYLVTAEGEKSLGLTPLTRAKVPRGMTTLRFKKDGYEDLVETVEITWRRKSFVFNLIRKIAPATIEIIGAAEFQGATVSIDGNAVGTVPAKSEVPPGRHHIVVTKDGYQPWERWIDATEGQKVTFDAVLKPLKDGSILITSAPSGAEIRINGAPRGTTPTVVEGLSPEQYLVELKLEGYKPFQQTIEVSGKKRVVINAKLESTGGGSAKVKITADVEGAVILLDGEEIGPAPVEADVPAGPHVFEAKANGFITDKREVEIKRDEPRSIAMSLRTATQKAMASVRVIASVPGAMASIDNDEPQPTPLKVDNLPSGTHFVTVTAPGYAEWKKSVQLEPGKLTEVVAEMNKAGRLQVNSKGGVAEVFIGGQLVGKTPFIKEDLPTGTYDVMVKRADGKQETFSVAVGTAKPVNITATYGANKRRVRHRAMPFSAQPSDVGHGTIDLHSGWPFLIGARLNVGIINDFEVGLDARSAFNVTNEFEAKGKYLIARTKALTAGAKIGIGFGLGGEERNSFFINGELLGSVMIAERASITAHVKGQFYTDRVGPESNPEFTERDNGGNLLLGLSVEFKFAKHWNFFIYVEGDPVGERRLYDQGFLTDTKVYGQIGVSYLY